MKILHVIHSLDPRSGGPSNSLRHLVRTQKELGHEVALLTTDAQSAEPWSAEADYRNMIAALPSYDNVEVFIGKGYGRMRPLRRWRYSPECSRWVKARFSSPETRPDIVHIHGLFSHLTCCAARQCRAHRVPYVVRPAGGLSPFCLGQGNSLGKKLLYRFSVRADLDGALFIHATSFREKNELKKLQLKPPIHVVPHGVPIPEDAEIAEGLSTFFQAHPHFVGKRIILFLSRIAPKKRLDLLFRALAEDWFKAEEFCLVVAGCDAGFQGAAEQLAVRLKISDRVYFVGFLEGPMKMGALAAADIFALPSEDENFGLAAMEALAHGTPVLLTKEVDSHHFSDTAKAGLTVEGDLVEISKGIRMLLTENLEEMGSRGREYAREHLSWPHIAGTLVRLYSGTALNLTSERIDVSQFRSD